MKPKNTTLRVEALRQGDKFAFLNQNSADAAVATMVVTRSPAVNLAANSCHFRYQPQPASGATEASNGWHDNQSWNGAPGVLVRLLDRSSIDPPAATPAVAEAAARRES